MSKDPARDQDPPDDAATESTIHEPEDDKDNATAVATTAFQFVSYSPTRGSRGRSGSSIVRSQAARHQWNRDLAERTAQRASGSRRRRPRVQVVLEGVERSEQSQSSDSESSSAGASSRSSLSLVERSSPSSAGSPSQPVLEMLVGGTRVDPFQSFPAQWQPYFPSAVDHYLVHMAVDIPELDENNRGSLRSSWFPLVLTERSIFLAIILLASSHQSSVNRALNTTNLLRLKQQTLEAINEALQRDQSLTSDALIGSVAKMAAYEAMYGDVDTYLAHMSGLKRMVELRGGLAQLGLSGLLRRMIIWIDINSSFLREVPRQFPDEPQICEPNPGHFIGNSG